MKEMHRSEKALRSCLRLDRDPSNRGVGRQDPKLRLTKEGCNGVLHSRPEPSQAVGPDCGQRSKRGSARGSFIREQLMRRLKKKCSSRTCKSSPRKCRNSLTQLTSISEASRTLRGPQKHTASQIVNSEAKNYHRTRR